MSKKTDSLAQLYQRHQRLCRRLSQLGLISQGSVQDRTRREGGGAGYQWTRKVTQKTVTVSLTADQFEKMKEAVANYRALRHQLQELEKVSRSIIFKTTPHPGRRKLLSQTVLGLK